MSGRMVVTESTAWKTLDLEIVANNKSDLKLGEVVFDEIAQSYVQKIRAEIPELQAKDFYEQLKHFYGDCFDDDCQYCKETEE